MNKKLKTLLQLSAVASIYVIINFLTQSFAFGMIQFRIAEVLVLLCFYNKKYIPALVVGCAIANIQSPLGIYDVLFGSLATLLAVIGVSKSRNLWIASLFPVIFNGAIVALEVMIFDPEVTFNLPTFFTWFGFVALGEFVCVTLVGVLVFKQIEKNTYFMENIKNI